MNYILNEWVELLVRSSEISDLVVSELTWLYCSNAVSYTHLVRSKSLLNCITIKSEPANIGKPSQ